MRLLSCSGCRLRRRVSLSRTSYLSSSPWPKKKSHTGLIADIVPDWQKGRKTCDDELEKHLSAEGRIFTRFNLMHCGLFKKSQTGLFKGIVRLLPRGQKGAVDTAARSSATC